MILGGKTPPYFRKHPNIFVAFVGSFECFDVGLTVSFLQLDFLFMSVPRLFPQLRCQEARGGRKWKQCHSASGMPELATKACGVLGAGLRKEKERM